jgi:2-methylaconitate cis-trans-isomerase PrpF
MAYDVILGDSLLVQDQERIRVAIIRGGTSKGVFLHAGDLPSDPAARDQVILSIFGSPDPRQIDGLGGADPLTSKVAIIAPSARPDADVDYTVGYVGIDRGLVDYEGNCGNISQAVGPFALDEGLVTATGPVTEVRIFNTNTSKLMISEVPVRRGKSSAEGDFAIHGVPGTGARIVVNFLDAAGSKTGRLLPTGNVVDTVRLNDGSAVTLSLVDAAAPAVFVRASDVGLSGCESPDDCQANPRILAVMEEIRVQAALMMKLAPDAGRVSPAVPKVGIVAPPVAYKTISGETIAESDCDLMARTLALTVMHKAYAVTGGICLSAAALIDGTVVNQVARFPARGDGIVRVGHPSGVSTYLVQIEQDGSGTFELKKAAVAGSARRIMDGYAYIRSGARR